MRVINTSFSKAQSPREATILSSRGIHAPAFFVNYKKYEYMMWFGNLLLTNRCTVVLRKYAHPPLSEQNVLLKAYLIRPPCAIEHAQYHMQ